MFGGGEKGGHCCNWVDGRVGRHDGPTVSDGPASVRSDCFDLGSDPGSDTGSDCRTGGRSRVYCRTISVRILVESRWIRFSELVSGLRLR